MTRIMKVDKAGCADRDSNPGFGLAPRRLPLGRPKS